MIRYTRYRLPKHAYLAGKTARPIEEPLAEYNLSPLHSHLFHLWTISFFSMALIFIIITSFWKLMRRGNLCGNWKRILL